MTLSPAEPQASAFSRNRESWRACFQHAGAGLVVFVALADFFRWHAVAAKWIGFGRLVPMAPATEFLLVVLGVALGLNLFFPAQRIVRRVAIILSLLAAALALDVLVCHFSGRVPQWESWFGFSGMTVEGFSVGYISTYTAGLVLLSDFALVALLSPLAGRPIMRDAGIIAGLVVQLFVLMTVVSYAAGNPPVVNEGWLKAAPLVMFEITLFNFVLLMGGRATNRLRHWLFGTDLSAPDFAPFSHEERLVFALLAGAGLIALTASVVYLRVTTKNYQTRSFEALQSMSDLKIYQIEQWRRERFGDAHMLMRSPFLVQAVRSLGIASTTDTTRAELTEWLGVFVQEYGYARVVVLNQTMEPVLTEPGQPDLLAPGLREQLRTLRPNSDVMELPPYLDGAGVLHWDLLVPLRTSQSPALEGAILLQTDPTRSVIQILQSWRAEYQTGQSMLWYREGDRLISLGGYRSVPGTTPDELRPFGMIRSISDPAQSQSMLARVARGELSMDEGFDHRGVMIVGFGRPIANSPWLLSSRVDSAEVYAPLRRTAIGVAGMMAGLLATTGFATSWLWRQRQKDLLHERVAAELEQKRATAQLGLVMRHAKDMIIMTDEKTRFVDVNQQAVDTYGWTKEELLRMSIADLRATETLGALPDVLERANSAEGAVFETIHQRKDGTRFPVEISVRRVELDDRPLLLAIVRDITERKRAEAQLKDSEEKFSKAFQANPSGIAITDFATGRYLEVNESFSRVMAYSSQELIGRTSLEVGVWDGDDNRRQIFQQLLVGSGVRNFELQTRTRDGETKTTLINAELIELNGRRCVLSLIEDITDRKRAEAALRASEERYRLIADNTSDLIWLYDRVAERFTYASPAALPLLGYLPEEIMGRKLLDFVTPASQQDARRALERAMGSTGEAQTPVHLVVELEQQHKDGRLVPTEVVVSVLSDASGRVTHILGVTRDITERKKARETLEKFNSELEQQVETRTAELAARNREIEALVGSIPDTVLLCDERGELVTSHFAQHRASAFPFATVGGGDGLSRQHPILLEIARELHTVAWASQEAIMLEFDRNINGVDYSIEARATPAGENRLLILLRDISARKRGERIAQANLERERELSGMKSQFVSVASHEFRTPLAAAVASLELLERHAAKLTEAKRIELLGRIQRSLGRLTAIMDDVLQLSRADSGRVKVNRMTVDLVQFVQDIIHEVSTGDRQQHHFAFAQTGGPGVVPVDTKLLHHIISNLAGNAVRYSPAGTTVSIRLDLGGAEFALTVADEGIGVPEAERDRIFEPFVRGSNVGQIGGTGLGLNIVKRYTELMGGRIELLPTSRGAAFRIHVPCSPNLPAL